MEITLGEGRKVSAEYNGHTIMTDQPVQFGGDNSAPAPFDLFLASLGTCAGFYVKIFCLKRNIPTDNIRIIQTMEVEETNGMIGKIKIDIKLPADFPEKYKDAVVNSANLCAVKKHIQHPPEFEVFTSTI
ncbi:MAG: OsmC family protein [Ignavibacteriae bacterium]|nr:OsmC family protein [Ignavibacteriota bacterium]